MKTYSLALVVLSFFFMVFPAVAAEMVVYGGDGDIFVLDVRPEDSFQQVMAAIGNQLSENPAQQAFRLECKVSGSEIYAAAVQYSGTPPRDYFSALTDQEKNDIGFIVRTLANSSLVTIASSRSSLRKVGDRVEHVHPLKFLKCIFIDEELKVCLRNLRGRGWVWKEFLSEVVVSINKEAAVDNIKDEYVQDFAQKVGIDINLIMPYLRAKQWEDFVKFLVDNVPRKGNADRYRY